MRRQESSSLISLPDRKAWSRQLTRWAKALQVIRTKPGLPSEVIGTQSLCDAAHDAMSNAVVPCQKVSGLMVKTAEADFVP
jgi:hypothetical protein